VASVIDRFGRSAPGRGDGIRTGPHRRFATRPHSIGRAVDGAQSAGRMYDFGFCIVRADQVRGSLRTLV
jgi:hypothetical protein